jgi:hypothetical protein
VHPVTTLTASVPFAPAAPVTGSVRAAISVRWKPPLSDGGSPITGYIVTPHAAGIALPSHLFAGSPTAGLVRGLTEGQSYTFTVVAVNAVGAGSPSPPSAAVVLRPRRG